jgi:hypothetical protein
VGHQHTTKPLGDLVKIAQLGRVASRPSSNGRMSWTPRARCRSSSNRARCLGHRESWALIATARHDYDVHVVIRCYAKLGKP